MAKIEYGPGTMYINGSEIPVKNLEYTTEDDEVIQHPAGPVINLTDSMRSASMSIKTAIDTFIRFVHGVTGISRTMEDACPNKRVVHLARYHKSYRVRKKNYKRMIRIVEKEGKWLA